MVAHRCFTLPRSSILCGCINIPGRQVMHNAVWGRYPIACTMYVTKKLGVCWGLVDKISPAFELRNSGVPCRQSPQVIPAVVLCAAGACLSCTCGSSYPGSIYPLRSEFASRPSPRVSGRWIDRGFVPPPLCAALSSVLSSRASLHFASAPLAYLCVAPPGQSPAYTYLKQPWQPWQVFALSQSLFFLLLQPILT